MTTTNNDRNGGESLPSANFAPQPKPNGKVHPTLQQVESPVHDIPSFREYLGSEDDPLLNWQTSGGQDPGTDLSADPSRWFPCDDSIALYAPTEDRTNVYETLSYRDLHAQLKKCPALRTRQTRVAIVIPAEQMAEYAVALLAILNHEGVVVPLDPRMPALRILDAMEQMECTCLVTTEEWALSFNVLEQTDTKEYRTHISLMNNYAKDGDSVASKKAFFSGQVEEIRFVSATGGGGGCGRIGWTILGRPDEITGSGDWVLMDPSLSNGLALSDKSGSDLALLLRTSGTTSKPKVVPISKARLLYMSLSLATALGLKREDCCANALPMYHIGGVACNLLAVLLSGGSVLMSGPLKDPSSFLDHLVSDKSSTGSSPKPTVTWYYAGPPMHKAIVLMAEARYNANCHKQDPLPNQLRFIRNAQSHINHDLVLQLSNVFRCPVIPTYAMTEAMPISFSSPIDAGSNPPCQVIDSVGYPLCDLRVVQPDSDEVLKYSITNNSNDERMFGEICVKGPGVISEYLGVDPAKTHSPDGWLRTGDKGYLDQEGRLFIKGRIKEMIKRGGEQVWPNEIDDVVEKVPGVATAVTFGVPNELWGEEVAVAVVLKDAHQLANQAYTDMLTKEIIQTCKDELDEISIPKQIKYLSSIEELPAGSSLWTKGKYQRSKMADHLGVTAVDMGALRSLVMASRIQAGKSPEQGNANIEQEKTLWEKALVLLETTQKDNKRVIPSDALNGVRFLVTCFVVQVHVGLFPNLPWVKLQGYFPNMMIFFSIAGLQTTCQVARSVKGQWANFVGTKVGALHSLFMISQLITFPSYVLFRAFDEDGNLIWDARDWLLNIVWFIFATFTGMGHKWSVNMFTWFQSTFYIFLALFPFIDDRLRHLTLKYQGIYFVAFMVLAAGLWAILFITVPSEVFWDYLYPFGWTIITWLPLLVAAMLAAYFFRRVVEFCWKMKEKELSDSELQEYADNPGSIDVKQVASQTKVFGMICDATSAVLLAAWLMVAFWPNCLCVYGATFETMRPDESVEYGCPPFRNGLEDYVWTCQITYTEFVDYIQPDPNHFEFGRFTTNWSGAFGYLHVSAPIFLLWCATMAFGTGYTSRIFASKLFTFLAPLGYPVYLLHLSVVRYYWVATRGLKKEFWWGREGEYPVPIEWWEFFLVLIMSTILGGLINSFLVPPCLPYTISWGVRVCSWISRISSTCARYIFGEGFFDGDVDENTPMKNECVNGEDSKTFHQLKTMIRGLTGINEVKRDLPLQHLGLDSLGATALLGTLRSTVPAARDLTLKELQGCQTVGNLLDFLDGVDRVEGPTLECTFESCESDKT